MNARRFASRKILLWFMIPYLATMMISLLLGLTLYRTSMTALGNQWIERNRDLLTQDIEKINKLMSAFDEISIQMNQYDVYSLGNRTEQGLSTSVMQILRTQKLLAQIDTIQQPKVWQSFLIYQNNGLVVGMHETYTLEEQYEYFFRPAGISIEEWNNILFSESSTWQKWLNVDSFYYTPAGSIITGGQLTAQKDVVTFSRTLLGKYSGGVILLFLVDRDEFEGILSTIQADESTLVIQNAQGKTLCVLGNPTNWNIISDSIDADNDTHSALKQSGLNYIFDETYGDKLHYLLIQDRGVLDGALESYRMILRNILIGYLAFGVFIAILLSYRMAKPWNNMLIKIRSRISMDGKHAGSMNELICAIDRLVIDNEDIAIRIEKLKPQFEQLFARMLLDGGEQCALNEIGRQIGIELNNSAFGLCALIEKDTDGLRLSCLTRLDISNMSGRIIIVPENDLIMLLFIYANRIDAESDYRADLDIVHQLEQAHCAIGTSALVYTTTEASLIKGQAADQAYSYIWKDPNDTQTYFCAKPLQEKLDVLLKQVQIYIMSGERDKLKTVLDKITAFMSQEMAKGKSTMIDHLCEIWMNYKHCIKVMDIDCTILDPMIVLMRPDAVPRDFWTPLVEMMAQFEIMGERGFERRQSVIINHRKKLLAFVDEHYTDPDLSLNMLASHMGMSVSLCSQQFKTADPRGFFEYLEDIRIRRAEQMLTGQDMTMEQIAMAVGYRSLSSFSRAFKRKNGVSATVYRKQQAE